jgi:hypothetical protein
MHAEHADAARLNELLGRVIGCGFTVLNMLGTLPGHQTRGPRASEPHRAICVFRVRRLRASALKYLLGAAARGWLRGFAPLVKRASALTRPGQCPYSGPGSIQISYLRTNTRITAYRCPTIPPTPTISRSISPTIQSRIANTTSRTGFPRGASK